MKAQVFRYDPTTDVSPHYETYEVPWRENITVLEVLMYIYENHDPIAFDYNCRGRTCGRCSLMLDEEPVVACFTPIKEDRDIVIEPLRGFPVIRDVVVDKSEIMDKIRIIELRQKVKPLEWADVEEKMDPKVFAKIDMLQWCAKCMCCVAACPIIVNMNDLERFSGPAVMVAVALRYYDPNDLADRVLQAVSEGLFECTLCGNCMRVCPAGIDHLSVLMELRSEAEAKGFKP